MSLAPLLTSRPLPLLSSPSAFCALSSDVLSRFIAAGCLNLLATPVEVDRFAWGIVVPPWVE
jgi:hypothetical protein